MVFKDYYKVLGLDTNKVSEEDIKIAYREKAKQYHPDMNVGDSAAEEIFKEVNEAYRVLSNEKTRKRYDFSWNRYARRDRNSDGSLANHSIKDIMLDILFGSSTNSNVKIGANKNNPVYGDDINTEISISLKEGFFGAKKEIVLKNRDGKDTSFTIKIPAGIQNNDKLRISGQGKPGKNGGKNGDLFITIKIKNESNYKLKGLDIYSKVKLKPYEAALGTKKKINIFDEEVYVAIPESTSSGDEFVIKGKGYKSDRNVRGDLHVTVEVELPKKLDEKTKKVYEELKKLDK